MGSRPAIGAALASRHPGRQHPDRRCGGKGKPGARCELHRAGRAAAREPSGGSWPKPDSRPHHVSRHRPGGSSWPPRHPGSWRGLCTSTRCSSGGCTSSSRWRSAPAGCTSWASPPAHRAWTARQARNLLMDLGGYATRFTFLIRGRDSTVMAVFDQVLAGHGRRIIQTPARPPQGELLCGAVRGNATARVPGPPADPRRAAPPADPGRVRAA